MELLFNNLIPPNSHRKVRARIQSFNNKGSFTNSSTNNCSNSNNNSSNNRLLHKVTPWHRWALVRWAALQVPPIPKCNSVSYLSR